MSTSAKLAATHMSSGWLSNRFSSQLNTSVCFGVENVCRLLEPKLKQDGFNVLNQGRVVYFPAQGHQMKFQQQFSAVVQSSAPK
jgi:hypothetical protein